MVSVVENLAGAKPATKVVVETVPENPTISAADIAEMQAVESRTIAFLKAQETEEIRIPGGLTVSGVLSIIYNGVRMDLVEGSTVTVARPVAAIIRKRIEGVSERDQRYLK